VLLIGVNFPPYIVAGFMIVVEIIFSLLVINEVKKLTGMGKVIEKISTPTVSIS